jgi:hypothetical protein
MVGSHFRIDYRGHCQAMTNFTMITPKSRDEAKRLDSQIPPDE